MMCPFCELGPARIVLESRYSVSFPDGFPIVPGHTLVIPRRHVASVFDLSQEELIDLHALVVKARERLLSELQPDAFNIGVNDGPAAGQTIPHAHIHLIPRKLGDIPDPRGGIRWIMPDKARYWGG